MPVTLQAIKELDLALENLERQQILEKQDKVKSCIWCHKEIKEEETYFKCNVHKLNYCEDCAKNYGQREIKSYNAPSCHKKSQSIMNNPRYSRHDDCILEKKINIKA